MNMPMPRTRKISTIAYGTQRMNTGSLSTKVPSRKGCCAAGSATSVAAEMIMPRIDRANMRQ